MEKYLVCELDDEHYTMPGFTFVDNLEEAKKITKEICKKIFSEFDEMEIEDFIYTEKKCWRRDVHENDSFYVTETHKVDTEKGKYLLVWYHAYNGVDFEIRYQTNDKEDALERMYHETSLYEQYEFIIENDFEEEIIVDTNEEWEIWKIVEID